MCRLRNDCGSQLFILPSLPAKQERGFMKHFLSAALLATGLFVLPNAASATSLPDAASLPRLQSDAVDQIDWRPYRHCHGRRWDRYCHGGRIFFGRERHRRHRWDRHHRRDDYRRGDRRRGRDSY